MIYSPLKFKLNKTIHLHYYSKTSVNTLNIILSVNSGFSGQIFLVFTHHLVHKMWLK